MMFRPKQVVKDEHGNHFIVMDVVSDRVNVESVATREIFTAPADQLFASDRVVF